MNPFPNTAYIALGTNLGDRHSNLDAALEQLSLEPVIQILRTSRRLDNKAVILEDQPDFLNQIAEVGTALDPLSLLRTCLNTEEKLGRVRTIPYGPRIIDLDIILYNSLVLSSEELVLPHPGLKDREYLQILLEELKPGYLLSARDKGFFAASSQRSASNRGSFA